LIELTETELDEISGIVRIRLFQLFEHGIRDDRDRDWNSHSEYDGLFGQQSTTASSASQSGSFSSSST
jgi:hypothetical protein